MLVARCVLLCGCVSQSFQSGYLFKLSTTPKEGSKESGRDFKSSGPNWKLRFFILIGNVLSCYADHEHTSTNKGEIFIFEETEVSEVAEKGKAHGILLKNPFDPVSLAAVSLADQSLWKAAFNNAVELARQAPKGFIVKISSTEKGSKKLRYCVLHENVISFHTVRCFALCWGFCEINMQSQDSHSTASSLLYLDQHVLFDANDAKQLISLTDRVGVT